MYTETEHTEPCHVMKFFVDDMENFEVRYFLIFQCPQTRLCLRFGYQYGTSRFSEYIFSYGFNSA